MSNKPFKTLDELIDILISRNVLIPDADAAKSILARESYYSIINGYKEPFIDKDQTNRRKEDFYKDGTTFDDFWLFYQIDGMLRTRTRDMLMSAEAAMKTATVYAFCYYHRDSDAYLDPNSYISKCNYKYQPSYTKNLIRLLNVLLSIYENRQEKEYIKHYRNNHGCLPLWVASKTLTFGNLAAFFDLQEQRVKNATCKNLSLALDKNSSLFGIKEVEKAYNILPKFRNICAHKERLYCARIGKNQQYGFRDMLESLSMMLTEDSRQEYSDKLIQILNRAKTSDNVYNTLISGLSVTEDEIRNILK